MADENNNSGAGQSGANNGGNDPAQAFQNLLQRHNNDGVKLASQLFDENYQLRNKNRELSEKLPKDGSEVFSKEDAARFRALSELGQDPKEIKKQLDRVNVLEADNARLAKRDALRDVAATGWDLESLEEIVSSKFPQAEYSVKTEKDSQDASKQTNRAYIKLDGKESPLEDFAKEKFPKYLSVLKAETAQPQQPAPKGNGGDPAPAGEEAQAAADARAKDAQARSTHSAF